MSKCFVIRGPAGVGKSSVAKLLVKKTNAFLVSFDEVLEKNGLDTIVGDSIPLINYLQANAIILPEIKQELKAGRIVILDGCFYHTEQHADLERQLQMKIPVISLTIPLAEAVRRNALRGSTMPEHAVKEVYALVENAPLGTKLDTNRRTVEDTAANVIKLFDIK